MLLAVDIGNTNLSYACLAGERVASAGKVHCDGLANLDLDLAGVAAVCVASVNPRALGEFEPWVAERLGRRPLVFRRDFPPPAPVMVDNPDEVGADRLLAAYAAWLRTGRSTVVVDFGTAITVDLVGAGGGYMGGLICPGVDLSARALHRWAALLPRVHVRPVERVVGTNTRDAINNGIFWGFASLVDGLVDRVAQEAGGDPAVVATGGDAAMVVQVLRRPMDVRPHLVLEGIAAAARKAGVA